MSAKQYQQMFGKQQAEPEHREKPDGSMIQFNSAEFLADLEKRRIIRLIEEYAPQCLAADGDPKVAAERAHRLAMAVIERCSKL